MNKQFGLLTKLRKPTVLLLVLVIFMMLGTYYLFFSHASTPGLAFEPESKHPGANSLIESDVRTSGGQYLRFGPNIPFGKASPGGTYADWWYAGSGLTSVEWTVVPVQDPPASLRTDGLLHYYAYTFGVNNATSQVGGGYTGFQTNGIFVGVPKGKVINFSIWGNSGGRSPSPGLVNPANPESGGYQIMFPYNWTVSRQYTFQLKTGPSGTDSTGKWWGIWVTDQTSHVTTFIGEERVPVTINGHDSTQLQTHTSAFGEDLHWWRSLNGSVKYKCSDFQNSSMATINVTANNGTIRPNNFSSFTNSLQQSVDPSNGYTTTNCIVNIYTDSRKNVQMSLGYWYNPAPDYLTTF